MAREYDLNSKRGQMMLNEPVQKLIPKMAYPAIISQLITIIYNLVDTYFVSSLGTNATAAVGVNSSLQQIIQMGATLIAVGTGSYISRLLGMKRQDKANQILSTAIVSGLILAVIMMAIGFSTMTGLVNLLGANDDCREYSIQYATYVMYAIPFMITSQILNATLRSEGNTMYSMVGMGIGGVINCILDPIFIFRLDMGVAGASIATTISNVISALLLLCPYIMKRSALRISLRDVHYEKKDCLEVLSISMSSVFRTLMQIITTTIMNRIASGYSTSILAAVSVGNRVMRFPFSIIMGFSMGYQPVVGFNWGGKQYKRVKEGLIFGLEVAVIGALVMAIFLGIFAGPVIGLFTTTDEEMLRIGIMYVRFECITLPIHAAVAMVNMFYAGTGRPWQAMVLSTARQGYCILPMLYLLPHIFGEIGITGCQAGADALSIIPGLPLGIQAFKDVNKRIKEQELEESVA